jgi:transcriptional regulator NrdR family protein
MICPKCTKPATGRSSRVHEQSELDRAMEQQRRRRVCHHCSHEWDTLELAESEVVRLRGLAHRAVMGGV